MLQESSNQQTRTHKLHILSRNPKIHYRKLSNTTKFSIGKEKHNPKNFKIGGLLQVLLLITLRPLLLGSCGLLNLRLRMKLCFDRLQPIQGMAIEKRPTRNSDQHRENDTGGVYNQHGLERAERIACDERRHGENGKHDLHQQLGKLLALPIHHGEDVRKRCVYLTADRMGAEKHIHKLLLLGAGESGKSTIFKQIKLLFQTGFDEAELRSYASVIHANVYQTIKILHDGSKEFMQNEEEFSKYVISPENKEIGEKLSEIGGRLDCPYLTKELAQEIETLWKDSAIQETYSRGNELQVPDCTLYFMENLQRLSDSHYVPTKEDVLYARVRTTGVVEIQFSPVGETRKSGEVYRLFDVGGQRNERRKWIHLFEGVTAVIFCAAISEYDQMLFEDENKNRMMETKELFDWVLKQPCFEKTSFMLFLNKFDIFEKKVPKVPLNVCEWFKDYQPLPTGKQEIEHAYEFVKKKFEELYFQSTTPDRVDRVFKIYRTTALDQKLIKKTFKLVDETLRRRNLIEAGLL